MSTHVVEVNVDATKVVEHKVSYRIGALDRVWVTVKGLEKPRVSAAVRHCAGGELHCTYSAAMNSRDFLSVQSYVLSACAFV